MRTQPARRPASASNSKLLCRESTSPMLSICIVDDVTRQSEGIGTRSTILIVIEITFSISSMRRSCWVGMSCKSVGNVFVVTLASAKKHAQGAINHLVGPDMPRPRTCCSGRHKCPKRHGAKFDGLRRSGGNCTACRCCIRL